MTLLKTYMMKLPTAATITSISSNVLCFLNCALILPAFTTRVLKLAPKVFLFLLLPQPATCKKYMKQNIYKLEDEKTQSDMVLYKGLDHLLPLAAP